MKKYKLFLFAIFIYSSNTLAVSYDNQMWLNLTLQGPLSSDSKWGAYLELQPRYSDKQQKVFETLLRPAIYYKTEDWGTFHLGYMSRTNSENKEIEKRYWTQWSKLMSYDSFKISSRARYSPHG